MMTSIDGRIDCAMTEGLPGVQEYYPFLDSLECRNHVSGKVTSKMEIASGEFLDISGKEVGEECYFDGKNGKDGFEIIIDNKGSLRYDSLENVLVVTSTKADRNYLDYLKERHLSYIVAGKDKVDLKKACEILSEKFHVEKMAVVGGGHINAGFLKAGLLDEIILMIGAGVDGREKMPSVFDGLEENAPLTKLKLKNVRSYDSGAVMIDYGVIKGERE